MQDSKWYVGHTQAELRIFKVKKWMSVYRKRGKIHWAKLLWIPPSKVFHGKTFVVPYV